LPLIDALVRGGVRVQLRFPLGVLSLVSSRTLRKSNIDLIDG